MLGPYRLDAFIGGGGMGAVFRALDTTLDRTVAVKVLARHESDDEETLRRFRNEAQSAARLDHENIRRVHAVGSDGDWHYIVFEFIEGENLRDLIRREGPFSPPRTVEVAIQVANALEHASQREVVHRDIKPSNIVITPAGRARIVDMGLARFHQVTGDADLTVSGMTLGTFDYISPEQARDPRAADVRSDLYSLGCTMFFMLAGRPPFAEGTMVQKLLQHQQADPPAITDLRSDVPRRLAAIIDRLMEKDPLDRYQRPAVLVADLLACAEAEGYPITISPGSMEAAVPVARRSSRLPWVVPPMLLLLLVGGLWLRSTAARRRGGLPSNAGEQPVSEAAATPRQPAAWRTAASSAALSTALSELPGEGIVEIDADGPLQIAGFATAGREVTLRAAAGRTPILDVAIGDGPAGIMINGGAVTLQGIAVRLPASAGADAGMTGGRLFELAGGSLRLEEVVLRMPGRPEASSTAEPAAAFVAISDAADGTADNRLVFQGVRAAGDATLVAVDAPGGGRTSFQWDGGAVVTPRQLLAIEGSRTTGVAVDLALADVVAVCGDGLVVMRDSSVRPIVPRLKMSAIGCRFVVTDPSRAFVEQLGVALPADYQAAFQWEDRHGRYEGGSLFRSGPGGSTEAFGDGSAPVVNEPVAGGLPRPADWSGWDE